MNPWLTLFLLASATAILYAAARATYLYYHWRGDRLVVCPESHDYAAVVVDAKDAAKTSLTGKPAVHLADCRRWAERDRCAEPCLKQIFESADGCLVRTYVDNFYCGKH